jgi:hypothetical protein
LPCRCDASAARAANCDPGPKNRELLVDQAKIGIGLFELGNGRRDLAAIGAVVVEELDQCDVALRVAAYRRRGVVQDVFAALRNRTLEVFRLGCALALLQNLQRFHDDFRILQEILANPLFKRVHLRGTGRHLR